MRNARSKFEKGATAGLVQTYVNSAYDTVKLVADNIDYVITIGQQIEQGGSLASETWVTEQIAAAVDGFYVHQGPYDASTNTPDLTGITAGIEAGFTYTVSVGGTFFGADLEVGDVLTASVDAPSSLGDWVVVNRNIDSDAFATAAQGALADTAVQPADIAGFASLTTPISTFPNDAGYTDDQTPAEIKTAYESLVPAATTIEAEAGTETALRAWSPARIAEAILALDPQQPPVTVAMGDITDVDLSNLAVGRILEWDGTNFVAVDKPVPGGGGATELDGLSDVDVTTNPPTDQQALVYDSGQGLWVPGDQLVTDTTGYLAQRAVSSNYTVDLLDAGAILIVDSSSGNITITLPDNTAEALPVGTRIDVHHDAGANTVSFVAGGSATVQGVGAGPFETRGAGYVVSLWKRATNTWQVWGTA